METSPAPGAAAIEPRAVAPRRLSYAALLVAAGLTGVYAENVPNFEVLSLVVFGAGVLLGARDGALVAVLTMLVHSLLNPYGLAHPLVTASKVAGEVPFALAGAAFARLGLARAAAGARAATLAAAGAVLTAFFDLVTNLATGVILGQIRAALLQGIGFSLWHVGTNLVLFAALGTPLVRVFAHYRARLSS